MTDAPEPERRMAWLFRLPPGVKALGIVAGALVIIAGLAVLGGAIPLGPGPSGLQVGGASPSGSPSSGPSTAAATPTPTPPPTPSPTPVLVPDPLDGLPVTPEAAARHPIAVMIDDLRPARPQSGFDEASIVWHAPAEGGIPRYMMIFGARTPGWVGPVRSARQYFITWAAEWNALYVHAGGSPQALETLRQQGGGQLVYNGDEFRYGHYFGRITTRLSPHNLYTDGPRLRELAGLAGATAPPSGSIWQFGPDVPTQDRPSGGSIEVVYPANTVVYKYDPRTNTYPRTVSGERAQLDAGSGLRVMPKNVIVMRVHFGPLNDSNPAKHRLEAQVVGSGPAWIATNGQVIVGTWRKESPSGPTLFFDKAGQPVTLTAGQTFIQVVPYGWGVTIVDGTGAVVTGTPAAPASPGASGSPGASRSPAVSGSPSASPTN